MAADPLELEAPPDLGLLADAAEALEAGRLPDEFAREELLHLVAVRHPAVARELRRRRALRELEAVREAHPALPAVEVARIVARRSGVPAETLRWWERRLIPPARRAKGGT